MTKIEFATIGESGGTPRGLRNSWRLIALTVLGVSLFVISFVDDSSKADTEIEPIEVTAVARK